MWTCVTVVYLVAGTIVAARLLSPGIRASTGSEIGFATQHGTADDSAEYGGCLDVRQASCYRARCARSGEPSFLQHPPCCLTTGR